MTVYGYDLLIEEYKEKIVEMIDRSKVCIIKGPTGCGKSTYIPYLLSSPHTRVAIIEPRRIAVVSLYNTLSSVMSNVGYKMRFNKMINKDTRTIIYTDGSFLNEIDCDVDYIIVDEVHERSVRTEVILGILKSNLKRMRSKVILMSATVDTEKISKYFNAEVIDIPGVVHPVKIEYTPECISDYIVESYCVIKRIVSRKEDMWSGYEVKNKDILVFLPGEEDINDLHGLLRKILNIKVYKIFSALSDKDQTRIYEDCNLRKVILSTNICETSLTIPGVGYVIDSGVHKVKVYDQMNYLGIQPISKESASQRLGRCNRTGPGICYRLYPERMYESLPQQIPEICTSDLSQVFLQLLSHKADPLRFEFMDYPTRSNVICGLKFLIQKDCVTMNESMDDIQLRITNYGRIVLRHQLDIHLAHFYQQSLNSGVGYLASILVSLISQDNSNFLKCKDRGHRTDIEFLIDLFEGYLESDDKKRYCIKYDVSMKGMEMARNIFSRLNKKKEGEIGMVERVFSSSYQHNLCERMSDGSYKHLDGGNIVWIHPNSYFFKRNDRFIVFVDVFHTSKAYARMVGRYFK